MNVPETANVIRIYHNGDGPTGGLKFFVSARQARALGLTPGALFDLRRVGRGLELVPAALHVALAPGEAVVLDHVDPFTAVWRRRGAGAPDYHRTQACPLLTAALKVANGQAYALKLGSARAAGCTPCNDCWTPPAP